MSMTAAQLLESDRLAVEHAEIMQSIEGGQPSLKRIDTWLRDIGTHVDSLCLDTPESQQGP